MVNAAIYNRVSGEDQEKHGTSLDTQAEACLKYCREKGYQVAHHFKGVESGLTITRPMLNELREHVRAGDIDVVVVYVLDRFSRDPNHGVILIEEMEKHDVRLEGAAEDIGSSELGKLINYIKGYAAKLEAEKIKERTHRGRLAKAKAGRVSTGGFQGTFGYTYVKGTEERSGHRIINQNEAIWVERIFQWYVEDGVSLRGIKQRLDLQGLSFGKNAIHYILRNRSYLGETTINVAGERVTIPNVTPRIISDELFEAAQRQLKLYSYACRRKRTHQYLLAGHVECGTCGKPYWSTNGYYKCASLVEGSWCGSKSYSMNVLEPPVWEAIENVLSHPEIIVKELEEQQKRADQTVLDRIEDEIKTVIRELRSVDRDQKKLLQWALAGFPEDQVKAENKKFNARRDVLTQRKVELENQLKAGKEAAVNVVTIERFLSLVNERAGELSFESKRRALRALQIKVFVNGSRATIKGSVPILHEGVILSNQSWLLVPNNTSFSVPFTLEAGV